MLRHSKTAAALAFICGLMPGGCKPEEKVVSYKPFFSGLEGVQTREPEVARPQPGLASGGDTEITQDDLIIKNDDGSTTLVARSGMQLMAHIRRLLAENDADLFASQVLSETTRDEYLQRRLDPREAFKTLKEREKDILLLFARMPMGEHSPTVIVEQLGRNFFRVRVTGDARKGLGRYSGMDMVMERGNWKLRWFF
jgi:hypothetical protein